MQISIISLPSMLSSVVPIVCVTALLHAIVSYSSPVYSESTILKSHVNLYFMCEFSHKSQFHIKYDSQLYLEFRNKYTLLLELNI